MSDNDVTHNAPGVVTLKNRPNWSDLDAIKEVLTKHFGHDDADKYTPPEDHASARVAISEAAPEIASFADDLISCTTSKDSAASSVCVQHLGLANESLETQRAAVYALSVLMGNVTPTELVHNSVLWDVVKRDVGNASHPTFSENDQEANYHTDSQFRLKPESHFGLYVSHAAKCGGGESMLLDGNVAREHIESTSKGRDAVVLLSEDVPSRVPSAFASGGYSGEAEYTYGPVFSENIPWRWRYDTIKSGIQETAPENADSMLHAVEFINDELKESPGQFLSPMPDDSFILVANHHALHGRTAFEDPSRHVLRIRFDRSIAG